MSWRVLLSEYPQAILENESAIAVLALMESEGFAKEEDLRKQFGVSAPDLAKILLHLQQNSLVAYSRSYVQITERGRALLDRFELGDDITQQALAKLRLSGVNEPLVAKWVAKYRAESLDDYLVTQKTARSWANVANVFHFSERPAEHVAAAGAAAIWLDDLRSWLAVRHEPNEVDQQEQFLLLIDSIDRQPDGTVLTHLSDALSYLQTSHRLLERDDEWATIQEERPEQFMFACHHVSRARLMPSLWAAEWEQDSECLDMLTRPSTYQTLASTLKARALEYWIHDRDDTATTRRHRSGLDRLIRNNVGDLLLSVLSSETLEDLERPRVSNVNHL